MYVCAVAQLQGQVMPCFYQECPVLPPFLSLYLYSVGSHSTKYSRILEYLRVICGSKCKERFDFEPAVSPSLCVLGRATSQCMYYLVPKSL